MESMERDREVMRVDVSIQTDDVELTSKDIMEQLVPEDADKYDTINQLYDIIMDVDQLFQEEDTNFMKVLRS